MKTAEDFKKAIGTPDAAFEDCVLHTLLSMESPKVRRAFSARTAWAIAAMLIVMTITAGAVVKKWDLQTFLRYYERNVRGNMTEPAITAEEWSNQWATIRVRELMHDGCMLYCVYEVVPKDKNMLLLSADADDPETAKKLPKDEKKNFGIPLLFHVSAEPKNRSEEHTSELQSR